MAFIIDGPSKIISLSAGTVAITVPALYSAWVDWVALSDNAKYLPAFRTVGGDDVDLAAGTKVPAYCYLINGWRVRPQEATHTLNVTGGILLVDGGGDPFLNTLGNFIVRVNYSQPVQAITVATGGGGSGAWSDISEDGETYGQSIRLMRSILLGLTDIVGSQVTFKSKDGLTDRVVATMSGSERTVIVTDPD